MHPRVIIEKLIPQLPETDLFVKTTVGEPFEVRAVLLCDGHEMLRGNLLYKAERERTWKSTPLKSEGNDIWVATFTPEKLGTYCYTVEASLDVYGKWQHDSLAKLKAGVLEKVDLQQGLLMLQSWSGVVGKSADRILREKTEQLGFLQTKMDPTELARFLEDPQLGAISKEIKDKSYVRYAKPAKVFAEPLLASFSAWYEFFPRSTGTKPGEHGTFATSEKQLEYAADLGFNVIYLPPIHPIGVKNRKGKNNSLKAGAGDVGSPWAIGGADGGHKSLHPELGTWKDFEKFNARATELGLKIALDIAFQCAPDHPYLKDHADWFVQRADGTIQYAENPPKKYEDIYPFDFYSSDQGALWDELKSVFEFWISKGITVFRVDNPHTKPFSFWKWLIHGVKAEHPEVIFLSEAFTRPHLMYHLAKIGFTQSYTYFTWRTEKEEIEKYVTELAEPELAAYYRPNFWPNTPDILSGPLRNGTPADYQIRLILAATLSPNYGIYGPAFELMDNVPRDKVSEEYQNSEKYEIKRWNLADPNSLAPWIRSVNKIRNSHPAFRSMLNIKFHETENDHLIAYSHRHPSTDDVLLTIVNLDPRKKQEGRLEFGFDEHGYPDEESFSVHDLLNGPTYNWRGGEHYVALDPITSTNAQKPTVAHIFKLKKQKTKPKPKATNSHE